MIKGFKIRIYPTKEQEEKLWQHIGACRYIWNYMLALQEKNYQDGGKYIGTFSMINLLKPLKNDGEHEWLYNISNTSLQIVCGDLNKAYTTFFKKGSNHPKFKLRKKAKPSYPVRSEAVWFNTRCVQIEKVGKVRYNTDYKFPIGKGNGKFSNAHISFDGFKWFLSFGMECENQAPELTDKSMGIDLGVKELATVAVGDDELVFHNINKSKKMRDLNKRIVRLQRSISRKYETNRTGKVYNKTKNIERAELKLRKLKNRQSNIRQNYLHQVTHKLVSLLPYRVVMEDLNVQGMMKNRHLSKVVQEQCFYEFIRQMQYKCVWNGIEFIQVDRFYPSSKTCSCCGSIKRDLKLSDRIFQCTDCGHTIDRDYNAAINLMRYVA